MLIERIPAPVDDFFADGFISDPLADAVSDARQPTIARCKRCHRALRDATSIARGYGRTCWKRVREVLAYIGDAFTTTQIAKATELIEDGGLVVGPDYTCLAVSSDGAATYVVDVARATCDCPAGQHGRSCYHLAAALAVTA